MHLCFMIKKVFLAIFFGIFIGYANGQQKIEVGPGPEDMVLDTLTGENRLIIACSARRDNEPDFGEIIGLKLTDETTFVFKRLYEPDGLIFRPHGIDFVEEPSGRFALYVVNHQPNENKTKHSILKYLVGGDSLKYQRAYVSDLLISPNDVAATPGGKVYVTNDSGKKSKFGRLWASLFKRRDCTVVEFDPNGEARIFADKLAFANGIQAEENKVIVACTFKEEFWIYRLSLKGQIKASEKITGMKGLDNIEFINEEEVLIPAHPQFGKFLKHIKSADNFSPTNVWKLNIYSGKFSLEIEDDGSNISAGSVAIRYKSHIYIGQVFNPFVVKIEAGGVN